MGDSDHKAVCLTPCYPTALQREKCVEKVVKVWSNDRVVLTALTHTGVFFMIRVTAWMNSLIQKVQVMFLFVYNYAQIKKKRQEPQKRAYLSENGGLEERGKKRSRE